MSISKKIRCQIAFEAKIGYGIRFNHYFSIIINPEAVIGNNRNIIKMINAAFRLHEGAQIGNNITIGSGIFVVKDIEDNATAVGNPARVLNYRDPARFIYSKTKIN